MRKRVPDEVRAALEASGLPWAIEQGSRHQKIRLAGFMVGVLPTGGCNARINNRGSANVVAAIRRKAKELKHG
jgi:hypothetical protein